MYFIYSHITTISVWFGTVFHHLTVALFCLDWRSTMHKVFLWSSKRNPAPVQVMKNRTMRLWTNVILRPWQLQDPRQLFPQRVSRSTMKMLICQLSLVILSLQITLMIRIWRMLCRYVWFLFTCPFSDIWFCQRSGIDHGQVNFSPFTLMDKDKMPLWEGCSTFMRHSPYPRPPTSITSGLSIKMVSTKMTSVSNSKNSFTAKLDKLDK